MTLNSRKAKFVLAVLLIAVSIGVVIWLIALEKERDIGMVAPVLLGIFGPIAIASFIIGATQLVRVFSDRREETAF